VGYERETSFNSTREVCHGGWDEKEDMDGMNMVRMKR